ncbi:hypothetical protein AQI95_34365 [Streptomyces yokosukanensis]|uniref:Regulatory protein n=1 Tax=Streptomyces yokosukanensis TaxID=67386 RepID=A0A101NWG4_9ACTN|nr:hypothetical protein [Streptomyces yokosukanensis]KUN00592.1 hypothetical protein AQI95_34365 [Streptomyces yokosukanensis]
MPLDNKPIDVNRLGRLRVEIAPEPRTTQEGEQRRDREGNPLWITSLSVRQPEGRRVDTIDVTTSGQPQGLTEGGEVKVTNLWANDWAFEGRSGTTYRADAITPVQGSVPGSAPAAPAAAPRGKSAGGDA